MKQIRIITALAITLFVAEGNAQTRVASEELDDEVRAIFKSKCADCHGPDLKRPEGRFGYVLDLRRIASNPELIIPWKPEESELWLLIKNNEMPPPDLTDVTVADEEKEMIHAWIAAGAFDQSSQQNATTDQLTVDDDSIHREAAPSSAQRNSPSDMPANDRAAMHFLFVAAIMVFATMWMMSCRRSLLRR